ncbi:MAG: hypothetical protein PF549_02370 [Patescibacteria group bacterium]|jgi:hypothetical protein|nr:hypothetical protein [Patescibacteria group bacterium]
MKIKLHHLRKHESKKYVLKKFLIALAIFVAYLMYLFFRFGSEGLVVGIITWSAFVIATPIPDGGLLIDFPVRVFTGMKMMITEVIVWLIAGSVNIYFLLFNPAIYQKTAITSVFYEILTRPWPGWIIIVICAMGTFLSLLFGDELLDVVFHHEREKYHKHKHLHHGSMILFFALICVLLYYYVIYKLGIKF